MHAGLFSPSKDSRKHALQHGTQLTFLEDLLNEGIVLFCV